MFATIPPINNPSGAPAQVQAVPTGIVFDGHKFLVCTFTGFPYPAQKATIYQVDLSGNTAVYQTGLSTLTDIELGLDQRPVVLEYGTWTVKHLYPTREELCDLHQGIILLGESRKLYFRLN